MKVKLGTRWERTWENRGVLEVLLEWRDLWVGVYVGPDAVYVCPLPCVVLRFSRGSKQDPMAHLREQWDKIKHLPPMPLPPSVILQLPATFTETEPDDGFWEWQHEEKGETDEPA